MERENKWFVHNGSFQSLCITSTLRTSQEHRYTVHHGLSKTNQLGYDVGGTMKQTINWNTVKLNDVMGICNDSMEIPHQFPRYSFIEIFTHYVSLPLLRVLIGTVHQMYSLPNTSHRGIRPHPCGLCIFETLGLPSRAMCYSRRWKWPFLALIWYVFGSHTRTDPPSNQTEPNISFYRYLRYHSVGPFRKSLGYAPGTFWWFGRPLSCVYQMDVPSWKMMWTLLMRTVCLFVLWLVEGLLIAKRFNNRRRVSLECFWC